MPRTILASIATAGLALGAPGASLGQDLGFVGSWPRDALVAFDPDTGTPDLPAIDLSPQATDPTDVTIHPFLPEVWVVGKANDGLVAADRATTQVLARLDLATADSFLQDTVFSLDGTTAYVSDRDADLLTRVDVVTRSVIEPPIDLSGIAGFSPGWMAVRPRSGELFVTDWQGNVLVRLDPQTLVATPVIFDTGFRMRDLKFSADGETLYVANGVGNDELLVIDPDTLVIQDRALVGSDPWGIDVLLDGSRVFVANEDSGDVSVVDTETLEVQTITFADSGDIVDLDISSDGREVFVPTGRISGDDGVFVIDTESLAVVDTFRFADASAARTIAVAPQFVSDLLFADGFEDPPEG